MTVITPDELKSVECDLDQYCQANPLTKVDPVGLALVERGDQQSWYVVMYCGWVNKLRRQLKLPPRDLHITFGFLGGDLHGGGSLFHCIKSWSPFQDEVCKLAQNAVDSCLECSLYERETSNEILIFRHVSYVVIGLGVKVLPEHLKLLRSIANLCMTAAPSTTADLILDIGYCLFHRGVPYGLALLLAGRPDIWEACTLSGSFPQQFLAGAKIETMMAVLRDCNITIMDRSKAAQKAGRASAWTYYDQLLGLDLKAKSLDLVKVPRNFSWVTLERLDLEPRLLPYLLAGSAYPGSPLQMSALRCVGIQRIITVHETALPSALCATVDMSSKAAAFDLANHKAAEGLGIMAYHFFVVDRCPPLIEQLQTMCGIIDAAMQHGEGVLVHCQGGVGRTNTVIIAYLMWSQGLSASEATAQVTDQRKIILSHSQKVCLQRWWEVCITARSAALTEDAPVVEAEGTKLPSVASVISPVQALDQVQAPENENVTSGVPMYRTIASALKLPTLIVLCGFPASGKSTFAKALAAASPYFVRINKDEMRGKGECENTLFDAITAINTNSKRGGGARKPTAAIDSVVSPEAGTVVIDNCNLLAAKRKEWCDLAHKPRAWCIHFDVTLEECKQRITSRTGHPTIKSGEAGVRILDSMQRMLERPSPSTAAKEGFERLIVLKSGQDVADLLSSWKIPFRAPDTQEVLEETSSLEDNSLLKFPRTSHIMNLGAATRDDKILGASDLAALLGPQHTVVVEEKLDGVNMGIFINGEDNTIMVQNRSHFISSKYHAQFAPLDHWLDQHTADLWSILTPGRHILYGEWLHATHSVKYTHLPGWFVAYDLYDRVTKTFASRDVLASLLASTSIPHVPLIFQGSIGSVDDLKSMITGTSKFNRTQREGIVARVSKDGKLVSRAKLVRADFIAGNERWNKSHKLETNSLASAEF